MESEFIGGLADGVAGCVDRACCTTAGVLVLGCGVCAIAELCDMVCRWVRLSIVGTQQDSKGNKRAPGASFDFTIHFLWVLLCPPLPLTSPSLGLVQPGYILH